jgi:transcriptional regulatory protein LevR
MVKLTGEGANKKLQQLAREELKEIILKDITMDMMICKVEGWDYKEYIIEIKKLVDDLHNKICT